MNHEELELQAAYAYLRRAEKHLEAIEHIDSDLSQWYCHVKNIADDMEGRAYPEDEEE